MGEDEPPPEVEFFEIVRFVVAACRRDLLPTEWHAQPDWLARAHDVLAPYLGAMLSHDGRAESSARG